MSSHSDIIKCFLEVYAFMMNHDPDYLDVANSLEFFFDYLNCDTDLLEKIQNRFNEDNLHITDDDHEDCLRPKIDKQCSLILENIMEEYKNILTVQDFNTIFEFLLGFGSVSINETNYNRHSTEGFYLGDALRIMFCHMREEQKVECGKIIIGNEKLWRSYNGPKENGTGTWEQIHNSKKLRIRANVLKILSDYLSMVYVFPDVWSRLDSKEEYGSQSDAPLEKLRFLNILKHHYDEM